MTMEIKVPAFPESVVDGTLVSWHKQVGDAVARDEILADIETDKVVFEVPATADGVLKEIVIDEGATVTSGQVIGRMQKEASSQVKAEKQHRSSETKEGIKGNGEDAEVIVAPAARKLMSAYDLQPGAVQGSGKGGRILKEDVQAVIDNLKTKEGGQVESELSIQNQQSTTAEVMPAADKKTEAAISASGQREEKRVPMTRLRKRIAERLVEAQHTAAILTTFNEVNMQPVMDMRNRYKKEFEKEHGVKLGFMSFFVKACVDALKQFPAVNASVDGDDVVYHGYCDVGIAVGSSRGLVVPILRDAQSMSMAQIEKTIREFADRAERGALAIEEITGGTFTITNGGVFGSLLSTPIINPPQSAILGMHKIQERPVVESGEIVIRPIMYLALSYDHRVIDGREAVQFLVAIKEQLEDPTRMLLEI